MENRTIYDIISLYEFVAISGLGIFTIGNENLYTLGLLTMLIGKQLPEKLIKKVVLKDNELNIRPSNALNCNMINQGGFADKNPGFPSGHSTVAFLLLTIFMYEYIVNYKNNIKNSNLNVNKIPFILLLLILLAILVPYSRYKTGCHTPLQVISGSILGIIIGLIYVLVIDKMWLSKYPKYINDKNIFYGLWFY